MRLCRLTSLVVILMVLGFAHGQEYMIAKDELQEMFDAIAENPDWDLSSEMLWGYFFTDADKSALERVAPILENMGYFVNAIYLSDKESEDDPDLWWLHIEKVEIHTVDSLHETNQVFYEFARKYGLDSYDGMDVGRLALSD